jgi:hypothetical protein
MVFGVECFLQPRNARLRCPGHMSDRFFELLRHLLTQMEDAMLVSDDAHGYAHN